jgi:hypothetical protein
MENIKIVDGLEVNPNLGSLDAGDPVVVVRIMTSGYGFSGDTRKAISVVKSDWLNPQFSFERTSFQVVYERKYEMSNFHYYTRCKEYVVSYFTRDAYREIESFLLAEGFVKTAMNAPFVVKTVCDEAYYSTLDPTMHLVTGFRLPLREDCPDKEIERFEY